MVDDGKNKITLALIEREIEDLQTRVDRLEKKDELITDLRVKLGQLQMQIKITWALLSLVVGGLISVAFSLWK